MEFLLPDIVESTPITRSSSDNPKLQAGSEIISKVSSSSRLAFNITVLNEMEKFSSETVGNLNKAIYTVRHYVGFQLYIPYFQQDFCSTHKKRSY